MIVITNTVYIILTICATHNTLSSISLSILTSATIITTINLPDYQQVLHNLVTITHHTVEDITTTVITNKVGRENMEHKIYETETPLLKMFAILVKRKQVSKSSTKCH